MGAAKPLFAFIIIIILYTWQDSVIMIIIITAIKQLTLLQLFGNEKLLNAFRRKEEKREENGCAKHLELSV